MSPYRIGDTVRCVDASANNLTLDKEYRVVGNDGIFVIIIADDGLEHSYFTWRVRRAINPKSVEPKPEAAIPGLEDF